MKSFDNKKISNKGFSLFELVVAIAIVAIVATGIFGFMTVGARTFTGSSSDVNLQSEAQLTYNQISDLLIDTAISVEYGYISTPGGSLTPCAEASMPASVYAKQLVMYNTDRVYEVTWKPDYSNLSSSKLYYAEYYANVDTSVTPATVAKGSLISDTNEELMSEYISDFKVDLSQMESERVIRLELGYEKSGKTYSSSHNVTLRNRILSGNEVPATAVPTIPASDFDRIVGPDEFYLQPGETLNLGAKGYVAVNDTEGITNTSCLRYSVTPANTHVDEKYTNVGSQSGLLTVGKCQFSDFDVVITTFGVTNPINKVVRIHVIRVTSIGLSFASNEATTLDETGEGADKNLVENEEFTITATVVGTYLDKASDATGAHASTALSYDMKPKNELFDFVSSAVGAAPNSYEYKFKMKDILNIGDDATIVNSRYLTRAISVEFTSECSKNMGYCALNSTSLTPVVATWTGSACKKKGDFNIIFPNDATDSIYKRGSFYPLRVRKDTGVVDLYDGMTMPDGKTLDLSKYVGLVDYRLTVTEEFPDGTFKDTSLDINDYVKINGTHFEFTCPVYFDPNATYTYMFTLNLAEVKPGDTPGKLYTLPKTGYTTADYKYTSNTVTIIFDKLVLSYINGDKNRNCVVTSDKANADYYPRSFGTATPPANTTLKYDATKSFDDISKYVTKWKMYVYNTDGVSSIENSESLDIYNYMIYEDEYDSSDMKKMLAIETGIDTKPYVRFKFTRSNWNDNIASRVRLVPVYVVANEKTGTTDEYLLYNNYIDIHLWNISIGTSSSLKEILLSLLGVESVNEKTYFPVPTDNSLDVKFPEETSTKKVWIGPFANPNYPEKLNYTLTSNSNVDGSKNYVLTLYYWNKKSADYEVLEEFRCKTGDVEWSNSR